MSPDRDYGEIGVFLRCAVISVGHSAILHLHGDAYSGLYVRFKPTFPVSLIESCYFTTKERF